ncbi:MAG: PHP domain-containing protein [Desulfobacterales bacterium]|nr:PHP domain-containing protein [Desulfobacterales bacterium]
MHRVQGQRGSPGESAWNLGSAASIDLHIHSTASDGTLSPAEIIALALRLGLGAISITDHDSIAGSREALLGGIPGDLGFLTGVEISAEPPPSYPGAGSIHILGYGLRLDDPELNRTLEKLQDCPQGPQPGDHRPPEQARESPSGSRRSSGRPADGQPGRPHIAKLLVKKGVVKTIDDAFDRYLGNGKPAYVDKFRIESSQAIELINAAGGIPVLAHPCLLELESDATARRHSAGDDVDGAERP